MIELAAEEVVKQIIIKIHNKLVKRGQGKGGAERGFYWILLSFEGEAVAVEGNKWRHWKEGQTLRCGAHQGQSGWSKTTGAKDFYQIPFINHYETSKLDTWLWLTEVDLAKARLWLNKVDLTKAMVEQSRFDQS
ncbi:hypothetical protein PPACK8108_LOCUS8592 [Phakopsora pachyrhizi]|uniref:Uncharacterized protein n=1 Tax=Phakopsora pachyrhizi TaxID=170000 RepID=A0AAV0AVI0_PHAPC|nr:hypothetical protein PPACK8108_LOCUS8592 [Phakopsora pachyrhizi]